MFPNIPHLKYLTDLILGKGFCLFILFHFLDSSPSVLNGLHFYFSLRDSASREVRAKTYHKAVYRSYTSQPLDLEVQACTESKILR